MLALTLGAVAYQFGISKFTRSSIATSSSPSPAALTRRSSTLTTMVATSSPPLDAASEEGWGRLDAQSDEGYDEFDAWATSEKLERAKATYAPEHAPERHHEEWTITTEGAVHDHFFSNRAASFDALPGASQRLADNCAALGFTRPSRAQADAFGPIVEGDDCVLAHPTGAGKSLAYVAPLVQRLWDLEAEHGRTPKRQVRAIVIVPTEELGAQVSGARAQFLGAQFLGAQFLGALPATRSPTRPPSSPPGAPPRADGGEAVDRRDARHRRPQLADPAEKTQGRRRPPRVYHGTARRPPVAARRGALLLPPRHAPRDCGRGRLALPGRSAVVPQPPVPEQHGRRGPPRRGGRVPQRSARAAGASPRQVEVAARRAAGGVRPIARDGVAPYLHGGRDRQRPPLPHAHRRRRAPPDAPRRRAPPRRLHRPRLHRGPGAAPRTSMPRHPAPFARSDAPPALAALPLLYSPSTSSRSSTS